MKRSRTGSIPSSNDGLARRKRPETNFGADLSLFGVIAPEIVDHVT